MTSSGHRSRCPVPATYLPMPRDLAEHFRLSALPVSFRRMMIEPLTPAHVASILSQNGGNGWNTREDHWSNVLRQVEAGERATLVALLDEQTVGYGSILWRSSYPRFAAANVPEIHDLATDIRHRGRGVATELIGALEELARQRERAVVGLGVGLYGDYGPAQRLYVGLGYVPDGHGVTYHREPVAPGASVPINDELLLWLTKHL